MGMNLKAIMNVQRQMDILSDGHQDVVDQAVSATLAITTMDDQMEKAKGTGRPAIGLTAYNQRTQRQLEMLQEQLWAQATRALRIREEIEQIKKNLKAV